MLNYYNVPHHFYADATQVYSKIDSIDQCVSKLNIVLNFEQTWIFKRKLMLNKDKTDMIVVGNPLQMRNTNLP